MNLGCEYVIKIKKRSQFQQKKELCTLGADENALKNLGAPLAGQKLFSYKLWLVAPFLRDLEKMVTNLQKLLTCFYSSWRNLHLKGKICPFICISGLQLTISRTSKEIS